MNKKYVHYYKAHNLFYYNIGNIHLPLNFLKVVGHIFKYHRGSRKKLANCDLKWQILMTNYKIIEILANLKCFIEKLTIYF